MILVIILIIFAYLLGSASSAILLCRLYYNVDIRLLGSKNPGASNVQREFGWKMGLAVFIIDALKGAAAVSLAYLTELPSTDERFVSLQLLLGLAVMLGHIFPIFFKFKGGKGVSVLVGILAAMHPWAMIICLVIFIITLLITKYISLSVLVASIFYPIMINSVFGLWLIPDETITLRIFSFVAVAIIWLSHISNIKRLINHTENKFYLKKPVERTTERKRLIKKD